MYRILLTALLATTVMVAQLPHPDGGTVRPGVLPARWIHGGPKCMEEPEYQIHEYNSDFYILRESGCTHYEKPFLFVLFGKDKAILFDTGAGKSNIAKYAEEVRQRWLKRNGRTSIPMIIAHTHEHGDHVAGDDQFKNGAFPDSTFYPATIDAHKDLFGIKNWPTDVGQIDLGGRVLDVVPVPGHATTAVALYDRQTGILIAADNLYAGRLYVNDFDAFALSTQRLVDFTESKIVTHVLGCHIENTDVPYLEFPIGSMYQPNEHVYEMSRAHLIELNEVLKKMKGNVRRLALRDFTIWPLLDNETRQEMRTWRQRIETQQRARQWDQNAPVSSTLVPADFKPPTEYVIFKDYKLVPLGPALVKIDYDAYMSSIDHLKSTFGGGKWPRPDIDMKEAAADMEYEKKEWDTRSSFPYAVLTADGKQELGCVYVRPSKDPRYQAQISLWVTKTEHDKGLDKELWPRVRRWIHTSWPFERVQFRQ